MKLRLKDEYFRGTRARSKMLTTDDAVLPGCHNYEARKALKEQHARGELTKDEYDARRIELTRAVTRRESEAVINTELHHGDMVVMHGTDLQKYYEHTVVSEDKLRFAITARYIKPEEVPDTEHHKGRFTLEPYQEYYGQ